MDSSYSKQALAEIEDFYQLYIEACAEDNEDYMNKYEGYFADRLLILWPVIYSELMNRPTE